MNESTTASHASMASLPPDAAPSGAAAERRGVHGWLLVLCGVLTVVCPAICAWLVAEQYAAAAPLRSATRVAQLSFAASSLLTACAAVFGAVAGMRLWRIRPNAVGFARQALLFGLAVDIVTTALQAAGESVPSGRWLFQVTADLVPSLVFFMLCFAYLDRSKRVHATYGSDGAA